jgi:hypothetical protein
VARVAALVAIFCITAVGADEPSTAYLRRVGPYRVGMTLGDMRRTLQDPQAKLEALDGPQCSYLSTSADFEGLGFMFFYEQLVRIDVDKPGIPTASGIQVGDPEEKVLRAYPGQIKVEPHPYVNDTGHYLVFKPKDASDQNYGMIFETDEGKVSSYRVGKKDAVALIEGCS